MSSSGDEAVEVCALAGLELDPWQEFVLRAALGERDDKRWAAFEVGAAVPRQNGKGSILEARELVGLFLLPVKRRPDDIEGESLIIHSAHQFDTSLEAFRRLLFLIESTPEFEQKVKRVVRSHGEEGIELKNGKRIRFRTRTKGGGRGFSCDCLILDEAMILPNASHQALFPIVSAMPNAQVWYTGSAVDQDVHEHGEVFTRIRDRGLKGDDPRLMWVEWSADAVIDSVEDVADDPDAWAEANPGLGIRIGLEHVELERRSMSTRAFAVERLGVGDWPDLNALKDGDIPYEAWVRCKDRDSTAEAGCFAFDVTPDRQWAAIALAGFREDGLPHIEVVEHKSGTRWLPERLLELQDRYGTGPARYDRKSPAAALEKKLIDHGVEIEPVGMDDYVKAAGVLLDGVLQHRVRHLGQPMLDSASRGARKRPLGDAWAWSRKASVVDICPLVACTLALDGLLDGVAGDPILSFTEEELTSA